MLCLVAGVGWLACVPDYSSSSSREEQEVTRRKQPPQQGRCQVQQLLRVPHSHPALQLQQQQRQQEEGNQVAPRQGQPR
jgi:hypothetical protein